MLFDLYVKNFALIDELRIEFDKGLNIITGETGSGKSIMVDALSLVLGKKASKTVVRTGEKKALIEASFFIDDSLAKEVSERYGIDIEEDLLIISREISSDGRSISRVNGRTVTQGDIREVTSKIIAIHGQNEHEQFLTSSSQLRLVDGFGQEKLRKPSDGQYSKEIRPTPYSYGKESSLTSSIGPKGNYLDLGKYSQKHVRILYLLQ